MLVYLLLVVSSSFYTVHSFRGLPSLPGYLSSRFVDDSSSDSPFYNRMLRVKSTNYPRVYNGLGQLTGDQRKEDRDAVLAQIRKTVQQDIQKISDEVGIVSKQISAVYNNQSISVEDRNAAIKKLTDKHPKIAPAILNLIGKIHKTNNHYNSLR